MASNVVDIGVQPSLEHLLRDVERLKVERNKLAKESWKRHHDQVAREEQKKARRAEAALRRETNEERKRYGHGTKARIAFDAAVEAFSVAIQSGDDRLLEAMQSSRDAIRKVSVGLGLRNEEHILASVYAAHRDGLDVAYVHPYSEAGATLLVFVYGLRLTRKE